MEHFLCPSLLSLLLLSLLFALFLLYFRSRRFIILTLQSSFLENSFRTPPTSVQIIAIYIHIFGVTCLTLIGLFSSLSDLFQSYELNLTSQFPFFHVRVYFVHPSSLWRLSIKHFPWLSFVSSSSLFFCFFPLRLHSFSLCLRFKFFLILTLYAIT